MVETEDAKTKRKREIAEYRMPPVFPGLPVWWRMHAGSDPTYGLVSLVKRSGNQVEIVTFAGGLRTRYEVRHATDPANNNPGMSQHGGIFEVHPVGEMFIQMLGEDGVADLVSQARPVGERRSKIQQAMRKRATERKGRKLEQVA